MTLGSHLRLTPALFCGDPPFFHAPGLMHRPLQGGGFFLMHAGSWQKEKGGRSRPKSLEIKTPPFMEFDLALIRRAVFRNVKKGLMWAGWP